MRWSFGLPTDITPGCAVRSVKQRPRLSVYAGLAGYDAMAYSAYSRNGADRLRKMEERAADAVRPKIRIMI